MQELSLYVKESYKKDFKYYVPKYIRNIHYSSSQLSVSLLSRALEYISREEIKEIHESESQAPCILRW